MNETTFNRAQCEARRFLEACAKLEKAITTPQGDWDWPITGTVETAAAKRASMDLSRALSAMRRPN